MKQPTATRSKPPSATQSRAQQLTLLSAALTAAALATSVLVTADSISVSVGQSLPQVLVILLAGTAASFAAAPRLWSECSKSAGRLGLLLLVVGLLVSTMHATWYSNGRAAWNGFWHVVSLLLFGLLARHLCRSPLAARAVMQLLILGAIIHATHAVHQVTVSLPATRALYQQDPEAALERVGLDAPPGSATRAQYESRLLYSTEPVATFALTNSLAVVLSAAIVALGLVFGSQLQARDATTRLAMAIELAALGLLVTAWMLTKSRTAFLSVSLVSLASLAWWLWRGRAASDQRTAVEAQKISRSWLAGIVGLIVLMFGAALALLRSDSLIVSEAPKSIAFRLEYWQAAAKLILDYPLTGVGLGNFQSYYPRYKVATASEIIADPHNWLLDIAATCSLPVLVVVIVGTALTLMRSWSLLHFRGAGEPHDDERANVSGSSSERGLVRALWIGAIVGWLVTVFLQVALQEMLDLEASIYGIIVGSFVVAIMRSGRQPSLTVLRTASLAACLTMLVCLLASGSWQASGIALPLAAWLAICCPGIDESVHASHTVLSSGMVDTSIPLVQRRASKWNGLLMVGLVAAFVMQTWRPVHTSWSFEQNAIEAYVRNDFVTAEKHARASVTADPLSPLPRRLLVECLTAQAEQRSSAELDEAIIDVQLALDELLECDPSSDRAWMFAAETSMTLAATTEKTQNASRLTANSSLHAQTAQAVLSAEATALLVRADEFCLGALERHPSNIAFHAQRAVVLTLLGRGEAAQRALTSAIALSDATPHLDRKLEMQRIWLPHALAQLPAAAVVRPLADSAWVMAEPLCKHLRK